MLLFFRILFPSYPILSYPILWQYASDLEPLRSLEVLYKSGITGRTCIVRGAHGGPRYMIPLESTPYLKHAVEDVPGIRWIENGEVRYNRPYYQNNRMQYSWKQPCQIISLESRL